MLVPITADNAAIYENLCQPYEAEFAPLTGEKPRACGTYALQTPCPADATFGYLWMEDGLPAGFAVAKRLACGAGKGLEDEQQEKQRPAQPLDRQLAHGGVSGHATKPGDREGLGSEPHEEPHVGHSRVACAGLSRVKGAGHSAGADAGPDLEANAGTGRTQEIEPTAEQPLYPHAPQYDVAEFFVLPAHRRMGAGCALAHALFRAHPGRWQVRQIAGADRAVAFWRSVIAELCPDYVEDTVHDPEWGTVTRQRFTICESTVDCPR